jgi:hypothetical protein
LLSVSCCRSISRCTASAPGSFGRATTTVRRRVYLYVRWYVCAQAAVVEGLRGRRALGRSGDLIKGSWWRVFGISIVIGLIVAAAEAGISMPLDVLADRADSGLVSLAGLVLSDAIIYSFGALSATLLYFDLRSRHDQPEPEQ